MPPRDVLTAIAVAVVGGLTFIAIKVGVAETTPRHSAAAVAPFAPPAPIVGKIAGGVVFDEPLDAFELWGALLVMAGLGVNVFGDQLLRRWLRPAG
jgi:O-acetylserine/cysteine efflux transporter